MTVQPIGVRPIPLLDIAGAAHHWTVEEIIRMQPGAYPIEREGQPPLWHTLLGAVPSARSVRTGPGEAVVSQHVDVRQPGGVIVRYTSEVRITATLVTEEDRDEHGVADGHGTTGRDLPEGPGEDDPRAAEEGPAQGEEDRQP